MFNDWTAILQSCKILSVGRIEQQGDAIIVAIDDNDVFESITIEIGGGNGDRGTPEGAVRGRIEATGTVIGQK